MNIWLMQSECSDEEAVSRRGAASRPGAGRIPTQRRAFYCTHSAALLSPLLRSAALCWYFPPRAHHLPCSVFFAIKFIFLLLICVFTVCFIIRDGVNTTPGSNLSVWNDDVFLISLQDQWEMSHGSGVWSQYNNQSNKWSAWTSVRPQIVRYRVKCWRKRRRGCGSMF